MLYCLIWAAIPGDVTSVGRLEVDRRVGSATWRAPHIKSNKCIINSEYSSLLTLGSANYQVCMS